MGETEKTHSRKSYAGWIGVAVAIFLALSIWQILIAQMEYGIKQETYISSLYDSYTRNMEECRASVLKGAENQPQEAKDKAVRETCITPINQSRNAQLLRDWGYPHLLQT